MDGYYLIVRIICVIITVQMAEKRNRSKFWWGLAGFIFPILAWIGLAILGNNDMNQK